MAVRRIRISSLNSSQDEPVVLPCRALLGSCSSSRTGASTPRRSSARPTAALPRGRGLRRRASPAAAAAPPAKARLARARSVVVLWDRHRSHPFGGVEASGRDRWLEREHARARARVAVGSRFPVFPSWSRCWSVWPRSSDLIMVARRSDAPPSFLSDGAHLLIAAAFEHGSCIFLCGRCGRIARPPAPPFVSCHQKTSTSLLPSPLLA